jgi:hypothetical protein
MRQALSLGVEGFGRCVSRVSHLIRNLLNWRDGCKAERPSRRIGPRNGLVLGFAALKSDEIPSLPQCPTLSGTGIAARKF